MAAEQQRERPPPRRVDPGTAPGQADSVRPGSARLLQPVAGARPRITARAAAALQRQAGNRAVSRLIAGPAAPVQRLAGGESRPAAPSADPKFEALTSDITAKSKTLTGHQRPASAAGAAQSAAVAPPDDKQAQGKAAQAEKMNAAKPGEFDKAAFVAAVNDALAAQAPKNLEEADDFAGSGKADVVKGQVAGKVAGGKQASAAAIDGATKASPDTSAAKAKAVTPLPPDRPPPTPTTPDPNKAIPDPAPPAATDFSAGPKQVDAEMAEAGVTEQQLKADPEFEGALTAKKDAEEHSATAPGQLRASEAGTLSAAKAQARMSGAAAMTEMTGNRTRSGAAVQQGQQGTKSLDEKRRAEATAKLQKVFDATKADVETLLAGLDKTVDEQFTREEKQARDAFTAEHKRKMDAYKEERYSGLRGKYRWVRDKFAGLPSEANQIFVAARTGYVSRMQTVISRIADTIGTTLGKAKARIAAGRNELQAEVQKLPADLQKFGRSAAAEFAGRFDELTESVNAKSTELVQTLASKYSEAMKSVDEEIDAQKEANKGIVAKAVDAVKGAIKTILALKDLLLNVLSKAASAVMAIIKDPIGFLGNLVSAVGAGLSSFISNIGTHLKNGLVGWLMGAMASTGLQMPAKFDLKGIIGMIGSLLGLTWNAIRGRIVSRGVPDQAVTAVEESEPLAQKLKGEGIGGIWEAIAERVGDLKDKLLSKISEYLIPTVLIAGITWLISMLNPASAFIKACKMIIDFITFIIERGAQIAAFVNSVLDAVVAIAGGGGGGVGGLIEKALAGSIPVLIGALAAFLGIGGIANKVKAFFQSLSKPVMKAVDWVADKLVAFGKKIWGKLKAGAGKLKDKATAGGGPAGPPGTRKVKDRDADRSDGDRDLTAASTAAEAILTRPGVDRATVAAALPGVRSTYGLTRADLVTEPDGEVHITVQKSSRKTPSHIIQEKLTKARIHEMIRRIANELMASQAVKEAIQRILEDRAKGLGRPGNEPRPSRGKAAEAGAIIEHGRPAGSTENIAMSNQDTATDRQTRTSAPGHIHVQDLGDTGKYDPDVLAALEGIRTRTGASHAQIAQALRQAHSGQRPGPPLGNDPRAVAYLFRVARLEAVESGRSPSHLVGSAMAHHAVEHGTDTTAGQMVTELNPMSIEGAGGAARRVSRDEGVEHASPSKSVGSTQKARDFLGREMRLAVAYVETVFNKEHASDFTEKELDRVIRDELRDRLEKVARSESGIT